MKKTLEFNKDKQFLYNFSKTLNVKDLLNMFPRISIFYLMHIV